MKKTILIDLDGVLNEYNGNFDKNYIPPIRAGAKKFLEKLSQNFLIKIFTTRENTQAKKWIINNNLSDFVAGVTNIKEPSYLIIDDRCIKFCGSFDKTLSDIYNFKVWYK